MDVHSMWCDKCQNEAIYIYISSRAIYVIKWYWDKSLLILGAFFSQKINLSIRLSSGVLESSLREHPSRSFVCWEKEKKNVIGF